MNADTCPGQGGKRMRFGKLEINPALSPGVLDTATWDRGAAGAAIQAIEDAYWSALIEAAAGGSPLPAARGLTPYARICRLASGRILLPGRPGGWATGVPGNRPARGRRSSGHAHRKQIVVGAAAQHPAPASNPQFLVLHPTDAPVIDRFFRLVAPDKGPRALGPVPRLGIGTRMTTAVWPAIWQAMAQGGFAANAIQNSVRELNFLETLLEGRPAEKNIAFGFGTIETGYTGSSYEGLWVTGVLDALKHGAPPRYGADADHIQVKRGADGLARAKRLLDATRYYSFYTLDVSDVLDYGALSASAAVGTDYLESRISDVVQRSDLLTYHRQPRRLGGFDYRPDDAALGRLVGKYWVALEAVGKLYEYISGFKDGRALRPGAEHRRAPERRAHLRLPDLGDRADLRAAGSAAPRDSADARRAQFRRGERDRLSRRRRAARLRGAVPQPVPASPRHFGVMADFHSGDDLSAAARQAIGRATAGRNHFKVSPNLQLLFAEVLAEHHPELFRRWWEDALAYAQREAAAGSAFAAECIRQSDTGNPSSHDDDLPQLQFRVRRPA